MYAFYATITAGAAATSTYKAVEFQQQTSGGESTPLAFGLAVAFGLTSIFFMMMEIRDTLKK